MESIALKNPEKVLQELNKLADEMAEARYQYNLLDSMTKTIFSRLCLQAKKEYNCSMAEADKHGYTSEEYLTHIEGLSTAAKNYDNLKAKYNNYLAYVEYMRSYLSCQKHLN